MTEKKYGNRYKKFEDKPIEIQQLAKRVKELRLSTGKSAEVFAYDNEWSRSSYSRIERGEDIRFTTLVRLCKIHNITMKEFFGESFD